MLISAQVHKLLAMSADTHRTTEDREVAMRDAQKLMKSQACNAPCNAL